MVNINSPCSTIGSSYYNKKIQVYDVSKDSSLNVDFAGIS
jgi:hypothetical protein